MPSKQELFAMVFKAGAFKAPKTQRRTIKKNSKATKPKQRTGCPAGWPPPKPTPKPKPQEPVTLFSYDIFHYHDAF